MMDKLLADKLRSLDSQNPVMGSKGEAARGKLARNVPGLHVPCSIASRLRKRSPSPGNGEGTTSRRAAKRLKMCLRFQRLR